MHAEAPDPDAPRVGASLDRAEAHVGDRLTLTVSAIATAQLASTVRLPDKVDLGKFELLDSSTSDRDLGDGNRSRRFVLQIAAYETGELELPAIVLHYKSAASAERTVATTAIPVVVKSVVDDPKGELQPLKAQRAVMVEDRRLFTGLKWAGVGAAALAALWLIRLLVKRRERPGLVAAVAPRAPDEVALERIAELRRRADTWSEDAFRPFHFALSEIVRAYLGARFSFDSLELTTTELAAVLARLTDTTLEAQRVPIGQLLEACDLIKFAKAPSSDPQAWALLDAAEAIVKATRFVPAPVQAQPAAEAAGG